jgi:nitrogen fixation NifU-like protein
MSTNPLYKKEMLQHYRHPQNYGTLTAPGVKTLREVNPLCGDELTVYILTDNKKIVDVKFEGRGCIISQAAASMLSENIKKMPLTVFKKMAPKDALKKIGLEDITSGRLKCALLFYSTAQKLLT